MRLELHDLDGFFIESADSDAVGDYHFDGIELEYGNNSFQILAEDVTDCITLFRR